MRLPVCLVCHRVLVGRAVERPARRADGSPLLDLTTGGPLTVTETEYRHRLTPDDRHAPKPALLAATEAQDYCRCCGDETSVRYAWRLDGVRHKEGRRVVRCAACEGHRVRCDRYRSPQIRRHEEALRPSGPAVRTSASARAARLEV